MFKLSKLKFALLACTCFLSACANQNNASVIPYLTHINMTPDTVQHQVTIKRITDLLAEPSLPVIQQAELYYQRGLLYDEIGLIHLSYFDMLNALQLRPDLAEAYNILGIYYLRQTEYTRAYESFDSVIELSPEHHFAYFNRAIALYYGDRAQLALIDFSTFYQFDQTDPYRIIWWYFAELKSQKNNDMLAEQPKLDKVREVPNTAKTHLSQRSLQVDLTSWGGQILRFMLGQIDANELLKQAQWYAESGEQNLNQNLCEAYFYIAKRAVEAGDIEQAKVYFKATLMTQVYEFVEYRYAEIELNNLVKVDGETL